MEGIRIYGTSKVYKGIRYYFYKDCYELYFYNEHDVKCEFPFSMDCGFMYSNDKVIEDFIDKNIDELRKQSVDKVSEKIRNSVKELRKERDSIENTIQRYSSLHSEIMLSVSLVNPRRLKPKIRK